MNLESTHGRTVTIAGKEWLYFSGTSYLGMATNPAFRERVAEGFHRYGVNFGGSRRSNLQIPVFQQAEHHLAKWAGAPAALTLSSGSLAGQFLMRHFQEEGRCFYAPGTHPALSGQGKTSSGPFVHWAAKMLEKTRKEEGPFVLVCDAIDPLRAQAFDFSWIRELPSDKSITLILDESHTFGLLGDHGRGFYARLQPPEGITLVTISSLGKAFGIPGGVIFGPFELIHALLQSPLFGGASPVVPAYLHALLHSEDLYRKAWQELQNHIRQFSDELPAHLTFSSISGYPVFATPHHDLVDFLAPHHIMISSFPYPSSHDERFTRIVLNSNHTSEDIRQLTTRLRSFQT